jgi:hypothetical protein
LDQLDQALRLFGGGKGRRLGEWEILGGQFVERLGNLLRFDGRFLRGGFGFSETVEVLGGFEKVFP